MGFRRILNHFIVVFPILGVIKIGENYLLGKRTQDGPALNELYSPQKFDVSKEMLTPGGRSKYTPDVGITSMSDLVPLEEKVPDKPKYKMACILCIEDVTNIITAIPAGIIGGGDCN